MEPSNMNKIAISDTNLDPNYGYVPFKGFQAVMIGIILLTFIFQKFVVKNLNEHVYSKIDKHIKNKHIRTIIKSLIAVLPTLVIFRYDLPYHSFSMKNLKVTNVIESQQLNNILRLLGAYVIIQVAAQDLGVKTGNVQSDATKLPLLDFLLYAGCAYSITQDRSQSLLATLMYFQLKTFGSSEVKDVCFD